MLAGRACFPSMAVRRVPLFALKVSTVPLSIVTPLKQPWNALRSLESLPSCAGGVGEVEGEREPSLA